MLSTLLAATESDSSRFVDLDVPLRAWLGLIVSIFTLLGIDLYRHRHAHCAIHWRSTQRIDGVGHPRTAVLGGDRDRVR